MKFGKMQCKDIPTIPILVFLWWVEKTDDLSWCNWYFGDHKDVRNAMPDGFNLPENLVHAKMRQMIAKRWIDGCTCGCRGDFELAQRGRDVLESIGIDRIYESMRGDKQ